MDWANIKSSRWLALGAATEKLTPISVIELPRGHARPRRILLTGLDSCEAVSIRSKRASSVGLTMPWLGSLQLIREALLRRCVIDCGPSLPITFVEGEHPGGWVVNLSQY